MNVYNLLNYGGIGDGIADESMAFQTLVDVVSGNGGGTIYLPKGRYRILTPIFWRKQVSLVGDGEGKTILLPDDNGTGIKISAIWYEAGFYNRDDPIADCVFSDFEIDGVNQTNSTYSHSKGIYMQYLRNCVFRNLTIRNTIATGLGIDYLDKVLIENVKTDTCGKDWVLGKGGGAGIGIGAGAMENENFIVTNCLTVNSGQHGIFVEDQGLVQTVDPSYPPRGIIISHNIVRDGRNSGIGICGASNVTVTGNQIYENADTGIIISRGDATNITISNNGLWHNQRGIETESLVDKAATYKSIIVSGNNLRANRGYQMYFGGDYLEDLIVDGNIVSNGDSGGIAVESVTTTPTRISIKNNSVNLNDSYGIKFNNDGNFIDISNNQTTTNADSGLYVDGAINNLKLMSNQMNNNTGQEYVINADIGSYRGDLYIPWSPTLTNITVGNGTFDAMYRRMGDDVEWIVNFKLGSTSSVGAPTSISLPAGRQDYGSSSHPIGHGIYLDDGVATYNAVVRPDATDFNIMKLYSWKADAKAGGVTSGFPMVWAEGDEMNLVGKYKANWG
jgi:parallel beta-helix repeat protein